MIRTSVTPGLTRGPKWFCRLAALAGALSLQTAKAPAQVVAITGATVHRVSAPPIENGTVVISNGRVAMNRLPFGR